MRKLALGIIVGLLVGTLPAWGRGDTPQVGFGKYGTIAGQRAGSDNTVKGLRLTGQSWLKLRTRSGDAEAFLTQERFVVNAPVQVESVVLYEEGGDLWAESQGERIKVVDFP